MANAINTVKQIQTMVNDKALELKINAKSAPANAQKNVSEQALKAITFSSLVGLCSVPLTYSWGVEANKKAIQDLMDKSISELDCQKELNKSYLLSSIQKINNNLTNNAYQNLIDFFAFSSIGHAVACATLLNDKKRALRSVYCGIITSAMGHLARGTIDYFEGNAGFVESLKNNLANRASLYVAGTGFATAVGGVIDYCKGNKKRGLAVTGGGIAAFIGSFYLPTIISSN